MRSIPLILAAACLACAASTGSLQPAPRAKRTALPLQQRPAPKPPPLQGLLSLRDICAAALDVPCKIVGKVLATVALEAPRRLWLALPGRLPQWWQASGLTTDFYARVAFLLSNVSYLLAGAKLLLDGAPAALGLLTLAVCGASTMYHYVQCATGTHSEHTSRWCSVDSALAMYTCITFAMHCGVTATNLSLAALSAGFFLDIFGLGYTISHSLWHLSTSAAALASGSQLVALRRAAVRSSRRLSRMQ